MTGHLGIRLLGLAGVLSTIVSLVHFVTIFAGAPAYRYLGAGERMARMAERGSLVPAAITLGLTALFATWAAYAFSGATLIRALPFLKVVLVSIGSIYTLRGLALVPQIVVFLSSADAPFPPRHLFFSAVSLLTGVLYLWGAVRTWRQG